jgi:hypothetical protein
MPTQIILTLPELLYERVEQLAQQHQQDVAQAITEYLEHHLPALRPSEIEQHQQRPHKFALDQEKAAYLRLHPLLKEKFFGKHVAVYQGQLIDFDDQFEALHERVRKRYPNQIVWMSTVREEPIETIHVRSPRFSTDQKR